MFRLGYNTNGLAHHRPLDAVRLLAELGYEGVALTPDVGPLDPLAPDRDTVRDIRAWAGDLGLSLTLETGARFVLDARRKHHPTLLEVDPHDRERRVDFLLRTVELAVEIGADLVSLWAGRSPDGCTGDSRDRDGPGVEACWQRLVEGLRPVLERGRERGVQIAFEPEPGMFVERPAGYLELLERLGGRDAEELGLCLDVGHLLVTGDLPVGEQIRTLAHRLVHVHLDDIRDGVHVHRMFGEGVLDLPETVSALLDVGYEGMAAVELSRDSHRGAHAAEMALEAVRGAIRDIV